MTLKVAQSAQSTLLKVSLPERGDLERAERARTWHFEQKTSKDPAWMNFRVVVPGSRRRFLLGWNGQRLACGADLFALCDRYPAVAEDVADWVAQNNSSAAAASTTRAGAA